MKHILIPILALIGLVALALQYPIGLAFWLFAALVARPGAQIVFNAFPTNCAGRLIEVSKSNGCSLTAATVRPWTPEDLEANALKEVGYDMEYDRLQEARLAGYRESTLTELVMSRVTNVKSLVQRRPVKGNKSMVYPFIQMTQRRNVNIQYWRVTAGAANPNAGVGTVHPGAWDLTVSNHTGTFASALTNIHNYFLPGRSLFVDYKASDNVSVHAAYKILAAATTGGVTKVTVEPNITPDGWAALAAGDKLKFQIGGAGGGNAEAGAGCYLGANSVSDYESYKEMDTAINNLSLLSFPMQTSRIMWEYTDQWLKMLNNPLMGTYFKKFWQLDEAEQRRQHQKLFDDSLMHSVFFGQKINEHQDALNDNWQNLPLVVDPANSNCELEFKTNVEGIQTQLINCGRFLDMQGAALDFSDLFNRLYLIKRAREADSQNVEEIDIMTDRTTAGLIQKMMTDFYQKYYKQVDQNYHRAGDVVDESFNRKIKVFNYRQYDIPQEFGGYRMNVFTHAYFDDRVSAFGGNSAHRMLWIIDWTDIFMGIVGTNQRMTQTNELDEVYRYVININKKHVMNSSIKWALIMQDPNRHLIVRNFATTCPTLTFAGCTVTDSEAAE
jgi:hypothetical protein